MTKWIWLYCCFGFVRSSFFFFFLVDRHSFVHNVEMSESFMWASPNMIHFVYWWYLFFPSNHFVASTFSRPITYSLLFFYFDSHHQVSVNVEHSHHSYNIPNRHDEKLFSWLVIHSFPSVIVGFVFWALTPADFISSTYSTWW